MKNLATLAVLVRFNDDPWQWLTFWATLGSLERSAEISLTQTATSSTKCLKTHISALILMDRFLFTV